MEKVGEAFLQKLNKGSALIINAPPKFLQKRYD